VAALALFLGKVLFGTSATEQVTVPVLVGKTVAVAEQSLAQQGLKIGEQTPQSSTQPKGTVLSQNPAAGTQLAKGQSVNLTVSAGVAQVLVPNLVGMQSSTDAATALREVELKLGTVSQKNSDQPEGMVLSQSPGAGSTVDAGSTVNIVVSNGMVEVPDVVGKTEEQAKATLGQAGFTIQVIEQASTSPVGTVLAQSPDATTTLKKGSQVTITVAIAPVETPRANQPPQNTPNTNDGIVAPGDGVPVPNDATPPN
jgi:serine/threonine-protein kinase